VETPVVEPEVVADAAPDPAAPAEPGRPVFDPTPFQQEVGAAGWTLHLYSFPDSSDAAQEMSVLARQGLRSAVRSVVVPDKGIYYRVYVGSFTDRAAARAAMPGLLEKLRIDWADPKRLPPQE
jgi:cell division septation protein DedD